MRGGKARGARDTMWAGEHGGGPRFQSGKVARLQGFNESDAHHSKNLLATCAGILGAMEAQLTTLYRPVGQAEMDLIRASGFREFPARLPEQPIFYPVLTEVYATQIARDWTTKDERSGFAGYVLRFQVRAEFLNKFDLHTVGSAGHREYWIPAASLRELNANIVGEIEVVSEFHGAAG